METRIAFTAPALHYPLLDLVESRLAIILNDHRRIDIMRVVGELQAAGNIYDAQDLANRLSALATTDPLWQQLVRVATVGETYFFRDRSQIDALWHSILPDLINERKRVGRRELRLWSAGCSTGEEPYSLAIMLRDLLPDIQSWDITIWATDLNISHLERAQHGFYRSWSFRSETPQECRQQWFTKEAEGYRIDPSIRSMVTFAPLNLVESSYSFHDSQMLEMDIILCRNVLIYFDNPTVSATIKRLHGALGEGGWLVLGHSESAHMTNQPFTVRNFDGAALYQKKTQQAQTASKSTDTIDNLPVSKPTLLAPRIVQRSTVPAQAREQQSNASNLATDKLDPWTLAHFAANREDWAEALRWLAEAEGEHKLRPEVHYLRGIVELQQGEIDKSLSSLRRAIYCKQDFVLAHFTIGEIFEKQGQLKKASSHWKQAHNILSLLPPQQPIEASDNLTVEMLSTVLEYRLENLSTKLPR